MWRDAEGRGGMWRTGAAQCSQCVGSGGFSLHLESPLGTFLKGQACEIGQLKTWDKFFPQLMGKTEKLGRE